MKRIFQDQLIFLLGSIGFLSGIFFANVFFENTWYIVILLLLIVLQIFLFYKKSFFYGVLFLFFYSIGLLLSIYTTSLIDENIQILENTTSYFTRESNISWVLAGKVSEDSKWVTYVIRRLRIDNTQLPENIGILARFSSFRGKNIDDIVSFTGNLKLPISSERFDYKTYLLLDDIYATTIVSMSETTGKYPSSFIISNIRSLRESILSRISELYPKNTAKLLSWILIGERANIDPDIKNNFNRTWLTHIIAVSGFNITLILIFLSFLFRSSPLFFKIILALIFISFFTILVGSGISVLRASVFGLVSYVAILFGKKIRPFNILIAISVFFIVLNPRIINFDISFHLSFLAVFGLLFFGDFFMRTFSFIPDRFWVRESLAMCFAAMVFTLPIVVVNFSQISIIAPLSNLLVVPTIPFVMFFWFLSMVIDFFSHYLAIFIGFPAWLWLDYILCIIDFFGSLSYSSIPVNFGPYSIFLEIFYFIVICACAFLLSDSSFHENKEPTM